ncbi:VCBS repeat-containing protein [Winogradskyella sp. DF17]|uniref:VCBS repeat-containing protein n=1 Tax=Winogradskyella pelagia TaxID=2819984 RepID=A0ABS3T3N9_9FLAO|nr:FG-GAP-like repeat-containing protein [Winogradskyella sp. DF17]MBO3117361.1 VCBS repeat-containing protein [Winogradskyella sp. DF17]
MNLRLLYSIISVLFATVAYAQISFSNIPVQVGIDIPCGNTYLGNGITFFDYDNDGWDDITMATSSGDPIHFLKNIGGFFVNQNMNIELPNDHQSRQINWVDIDNDGDNDLFITSDTHGNSLFENLGNMVMQDITAASGMLPEVFPYYGASWGDYNNDSYLDVFISVRDIDIPSILYKNNGNGTFTLANSEAGLLDDGMMSFCSAFLDYDNDGDQDIYVSNDKEAYRNLMYKNNGDGTFTEVGQETGTDLLIDAMSVTVDDLNSDGWLDIYVTNDGTEDSALLINNGNGTFSDLSSSYGTVDDIIGWGAIFVDADNDTDLDLYVSGETDASFPQYLSSAFYENMGNNSFQLNNTAVPNDISESYSNAIGDLDNDGYTDFVVNNINHPNISFWKNSTPQTNNWLKVKLVGTVSNRNGVGSFIEISINGQKQYGYTLIGEGYLSQNSATEFFGLGSKDTIDYVRVNWLSGIEDVIYNVSANQTLNIVEGSALSINESNLGQFFYYPNPVSDILTLNSALDTIKEVTIFNMLGQQVMQLQPNALTSKLDMSNLQTGTYFVRVTSNNVIETTRVVKQ